MKSRERIDELFQATATPAGEAEAGGPWGPDVPMWRHTVRVELPEGSSGNAASPMPLLRQRR